MVNETALVTVLLAPAQLGLLDSGTFVHSTIKGFERWVMVPRWWICSRNVDV